ncbi:MAG: YfhO family protein [Stomatobaculum sp.]
MRTMLQKQRRSAALTAFAVPVLVILLIFIQRGIFPFGEQSFLRTDLYHQYAPFFSEFRHKLTGGGSLLYSWNVGMGVNFAAIYAYYLASPLNWLIVLCPKNYIIEFITLMIVIKTGLCGLTMTRYLQLRAAPGGATGAPTAGTAESYAALFGILYALSGYMAAYSWNIMWLDCILLFPLICLGAERLMAGKDCLLYTVTLGISILSNYYISIMICLFLILYAAAQTVLEPGSLRGLLQAAGRFAGCSLIAGGMAAALLLPEIFALQSTASGAFSFPKTFEAYFSILDMLARHMGNVDCEIGLEHWPNIYCGALVFQLVPLYIANRRISLREKTVYSVLLLFFLASFSVNVLNYIWHGFHYPNSLPARQSFIYIFLVLCICFRAVEQREGNTEKDLVISFFLVFFFILFCQKTVEQKHFGFGVYYAAMLFVSLYALIFWLERKGQVRKLWLRRALLLLVSAETLANLAGTSVLTTSRKEYIADNADIRTLRDSVQQEPFARFKKVRRKSKDDGAWLNFPSVSFFSSTADKALSDFMRDLGCEASVNAYSIVGSTPLTDALLDVKYSFYPSENYNPYLKELGRSGNTVLYENPFTFPLGYLVAPDFSENWVRTLENPADVQNDLCTLMGVAPVLTEAAGETQGGNLIFTAAEEGEYYAFATDARIDKLQAELPGDTRSFENLKRRYFMELGTLYAGESVTLSRQDEGSAGAPEVKIYRFDYEALRALRETLGSRALQISEFTDTGLRGEVRAEQASVLLTSIPYDAGWSVTVDGRSVKAERGLDAFLAVRLSPGTHELQLRYLPRGLKEGVLISALALFLLSLLCVSAAWRKRTWGIEEADEEAECFESEEFASEELEAAEFVPEEPVLLDLYGDKERRERTEKAEEAPEHGTATGTVQEEAEEQSCKREKKERREV